MESRRSVLKKAGAAGVAVAAGLAGCTGGGDNGTDGGGGGGGGGDTVTTAYVYNETISDIGWTHTHEVAREALEEELDWYETQVTADVPPSEAQSTFRTLAEQGVDVIEAATADILEALKRDVAAEGDD